jgi:NitT/TauT family transport system substrate-binding protein
MPTSSHILRPDSHTALEPVISSGRQDEVVVRVMQRRADPTRDPWGIPLLSKALALEHSDQPPAPGAPTFAYDQGEVSMQFVQALRHHTAFRRPPACSTALALALAIISTSITAAAELTPFKIGISAPVVTIVPVWMAESAGLYAKEGLKVEVISTEGGSRGLQVLLSGEIQGMHVGLAPVVQANTAGADFRAITSTSNTVPITVFTKPSIKDANRLRGATIGISTFGSETDIAVSLMLKKLRLARQDVTISQIGGSGQRLGALLTGRVDAAPLLEPGIALARAKGFYPILDLAAEKTPWIFDSVVVTKSYMQQHRDTLTQFVRAYIAGAYLALADEKRAKEMIALKFQTQDASVIDATYNNFKQIMPLNAEPSVAGAKNVIAQLEAIGVDVGSKNVNDYLDDSIIRRLEQDGYFARMDKEYPLR